MLEQPQ
jgi:hypothetical protein